MIDLILPPAFIFLIGAILVPFIPEKFRSWLVISIPFVTFLYILQLDSNASFTVPFLKYNLDMLRVDAWSKVFAYVFTISAFATFIYGLYYKKSTQLVSALLYIGSALGVVFAADLLTLYMYWELMAITSVYLILARKTKKARRAGTRYVIVHILGGLILLAGIVLHLNATGSLAFTSFTTQSLSSWLILIGFLINAAGIPFSSWLPDAYPEASVIGGVILSAYTSKTAVYTLLRGFPGWDILIYIGCGMALYGIIYALMENDMRRILAYSIVNQVGFMVCAVGIGTKLALAGAAAHAFCHIVYKALLWMSAGAVLFRTGKTKLTELGGLHQTMPLTFIFGTIGALTNSAFPFTSGFTSKTIILKAAEYAHLFWPWFILEIASAVTFLYVGLRFPYYVFFGKDYGDRPKEANKSMLVGMGILASICIFIGCYPKVLYSILPNLDVVTKYVPQTFSDIYIHHFSHLVTKVQMLSFSGLVFFIALPYLKQTNTITIDFDWVYRKGWGVFYKTVSVLLNALNHVTHDLFVNRFTKHLIYFTQNAPAKLLSVVLVPLWIMSGQNESQIKKNIAHMHHVVSTNTFPIGLAALGTIAALALLLII